MTAAILGTAETFIARTQDACSPSSQLFRQRAPPQGRALPPFARVPGPERSSLAAADPGPRRPWRTPSMQNEPVSIRIIPNEHGHPPGTRADAEVMMKPRQTHGVG
jgi:hypothetical protein